MRTPIGTGILRAALVAAILTNALTGCGGGGSESSAANNTQPGNNGNNNPAQIQGIATPSSVAVVTATNAN